MKKWLVMLFICAAGVIACGKKIMPESGANDPSKPVNEKEEKASRQSANTNSSSNTEPAFGDMKGAQTVIPDGSKPVPLDPGKNIYVTKCGSCHTPKTPSDYTVDQMYAILKKEIPKAKLSKVEAEQVTAYFLANTKK